jgi:hypothetical protein
MSGAVTPLAHYASMAGFLVKAQGLLYLLPLTLTLSGLTDDVESGKFTILEEVMD